MSTLEDSLPPGFPPISLSRHSKVAIAHAQQNHPLLELATRTRENIVFFGTIQSSGIWSAGSSTSAGMRPK